MSPYRREQAISAMADLLIVQLEREAQQPALLPKVEVGSLAAARGRGEP
jgi:hypothetical protein